MNTLLSIVFWPQKVGKNDLAGLIFPGIQQIDIGAGRFSEKSRQAYVK
jgi:hypothetical protein